MKRYKDKKVEKNKIFRSSDTREEFEKLNLDDISPCMENILDTICNFAKCMIMCIINFIYNLCSTVRCINQEPSDISEEERNSEYNYFDSSSESDSEDESYGPS